MKKRFVWLTLMVLMTGTLFAVSPPVTESFQPFALPVDAHWAFESYGQGRMGVAADTFLAPVLVSVPTNGSKVNSTFGDRVRGDRFDCTQDVFLVSQAMPFSTTSSVSVTFFVYEANTPGGTYNLVATNATTTGTGAVTARVSSLSIPLHAGRSYLLGAAWSESIEYFYYTGATTGAVAFGHLHGGFALSGTLPGAVTNPTSHATLYPLVVGVTTGGVLRMDDTTSDATYSTNRATLTVNLGGFESAWLSFRHRSWGDEQHDDDGLFLSTNGANYVRIHDLAVASTNWQSLTLDLAALADDHGMELGPETRIRFQQMDNDPFASDPASGDGREFGALAVYSLPDIRNNGLAFASDGLHRGVTNPIVLRYTNNITRAGGLTNLNDQPVSVKLSLHDLGGSTIHTAGHAAALSFPALAALPAVRSFSFTVPAGVKLSNLFYYGATEWNDDRNMTEGSYQNNTASNLMVMNHYSGRLLFNEIETWVTVTNWLARDPFSPSNHFIHGHGTLNGYPFTFDKLAVIKILTRWTTAWRRTTPMCFIWRT